MPPRPSSATTRYRPAITVPGAKRSSGAGDDPAEPAPVASDPTTRVASVAPGTTTVRSSAAPHRGQAVASGGRGAEQSGQALMV